MRGRFAPRVVGLGLLGVAGLAALFALVGLAWGQSWRGFLLTALAGGAGGLPLVLWGRAAGVEPTRREALVATLLAWLAVPLVGAIPYVVDGGMIVVDALFESMSGFSSTGATVLGDFEALDRTLFLWRALSQWVGGIGIIVLFIAVFPQLAIAGRQLFSAEAPGTDEERLTPRLRTTALAVVSVYLVLTIGCTGGYLVTGLTPYDAVVHALTTVSGGGFSPEPRSFEGFGAATQWVAVLFMLLAGANFALLFRSLLGRPRTLLRDAEFRTYLIVAAGATALLTVLLAVHHPGEGTLRHAAFQSVSILTTTGFASTDFGLWEEPAQTILLLLMFVGGSAGSAAGGIKVVRLLIVAKNTTREVRRSLHPRAVLPVRVGRRTVPEEVLRSVAAFITLYVGLFMATAALLVLLGSGYVTAFSAAIATLGNTGPGLGDVGPMSSFASLPTAAKAILIFTMYAGRLEVVTVFVVLTTGWWRLPRRGRSLVRGA